MATTHDATPYFAGQAPAWGMAGGGGGFLGVLNFHVDMAKVKAYLGATIDANAVDILQMWDIPAGTWIGCVRTELITPEGAAATITIGDTSVPAGFLAAFSINGVAGTNAMTIITDANMLTGGKTYVTTDTLDVAFTTGDTDVAVAVFDVQVLCAIFRRIVTPIW